MFEPIVPVFVVLSKGEGFWKLLQGRDKERMGGAKCSESDKVFRTRLPPRPFSGGVRGSYVKLRQYRGVSTEISLTSGDLLSHPELSRIQPKKQGRVIRRGTEAPSLIREILKLYLD